MDTTHGKLVCGNKDEPKLINLEMCPRQCTRHLDDHLNGYKLKVMKNSGFLNIEKISSLKVRTLIFILSPT